MVLGLFKRFLKPNAAADEPAGSKAANDQVRETIREMGDDGKSERHVRHFVYPIPAEKPVPRSEILELMEAIGLEVSDANFHEGLVAEHYAVVASDAFDALTEGLRDEIASRGWEYDGWECAVVRT